MQSDLNDKRYDDREELTASVVYEQAPTSRSESIRLQIGALLRMREILKSPTMTETSSSLLRNWRPMAAKLQSLLLNLRPRYMRSGGLTPTKKAHVTSYLDALRGWAAVIVLCHHHNPFPNAWILHQPFVRLLIHGPAMVDLFFVISGYVLSFRMLKLMRTKQATQLLDTFVSSIFRRFIRLYGSAAIASFVGLVLIELGWYRCKFLQPTLLGQVWHWILDLISFCNVFANMEGYFHRGVLNSRYGDVLWTIPVEFRGSMVLFTFCIGSCKLSTRNRMILCCSLIGMSYYWGAVYIAMFLGGLFLADLSFSKHPERLVTAPPLVRHTTDEKADPDHTQSLQEKWFYSIVLVVSLFLLSQPAGDLQLGVWPWPLLDFLIPAQYRNSARQEHWWIGIGALLLVWALDSFPTLQTPLKWNFSRYLGDLSFGIYVMHFLVIKTVWANIINPLRFQMFGVALWSFVPAWLLNFAVVLWAADLFIRVDTRVVAFGKWSQEALFVW